jgi:hypothetical protein
VKVVDHEDGTDRNQHDPVEPVMQVPSKDVDATVL